MISGGALTEISESNKGRKSAAGSGEPLATKGIWLGVNSVVRVIGSMDTSGAADATGTNKSTRGIRRVAVVVVANRYPDPFCHPI